ncbi:MAG: NADH-quinone oxidoreductase subunit NuoH [Phycisphaerales bacterium]|nr:NADH-quinone oxidoreductase subunit NuoH [Phycisphaerales bacterium]
MPFTLDPHQVQLAVSILVIVVMLHVILGGCAYSIMLERKLSAWMQDRVGPNRVGPRGLFQPLADGLKFLLKEDYNPRGVDKWLFLLAPAFIMTPAMIGFIIVPFAGSMDITGLITMIGIAEPGAQYVVRLIGADINIGVIYLVAVASLGVYGVVLGGWASNNKFSFLGGLRASAQMVSYEIPMGLSLLAVILMAGTLDPFMIIQQQQEGAWNLLQMPVAAILFYTCMLAESNRAPFDLAEAESELIGGYHTEYSSMKFAIFFLGEYFHMITGAAFFTMLFLGGWSLNPVAGLFGWDFTNAGQVWWLGFLQVGIVIFKIFLMVAFGMAVRWTLPRFRFDQLMKLAWEGMIPASLLVVLVTSVWIYLGLQDWMFLASLGTILIIFIVHPFMPRQANPNRRIKMIGSRFSPLQSSDIVSSEGIESSSN